MSERTPIRWVKPPAFLVAVAGIVGAIGIGMTVVGSQTIGVSTDEPGHVRRINNYMATGLYVRRFETEAVPPGTIPPGAYVYGPITSLFQHDVQRLLDTETYYQAKTRPHHYAIRHGIIAATAILGLLAVVALAWVILGDWRWGVIAGGILAATPLWTGHGMYNLKDVPVATGHTLITLGLVLLALAKPTTRKLALLSAAGSLAFGTALMLGTRPGAWPSLVGSLVVFAVIVARSDSARTRAHVVRIGVSAAAALATAYALLVAIYPRVFSEPLTWLYMSAIGSAKYEGLGDHIPSDRGYLFAHALIDLPLGLLTLMGAGTVAAFILLVVKRRRSTQLDCIALVGSQAFALTTAAVVLDSALYHGLRQMLFAIPALAVLAAFGLAVLLTRFRAGLAFRAIAIGACFAMVLPTAVQAAMFPYQYSYINVAAEQLGVNADDDYFGTSFREYAYDGPQTVKVVCPFLRFGGVIYREDPDCRTRFAYTFSAFWRGRPTPDRPKTDEFYAILRGSRPTPPNCKPYRQVERWRNLEHAVMSRMFVCHPPTPRQVKLGNDMTNRNRAAAGLPTKFPLPVPPTASPTDSPTAAPTDSPMAPPA